AGDFRLALDIPAKIVWAPHYYSPSVYPQTYLVKDATRGKDVLYGYSEWTDNELSDIVRATSEDMFGYLRHVQDGAIVFGEFGGLYALDAHPLKTSRRVIQDCMKVMKEPGYGGGYMWSLNPESGYAFNPSDTAGYWEEGLLKNDWVTVNMEYLHALEILDDMPNLRFDLLKWYDPKNTLVHSIKSHTYVNRDGSPVVGYNVRAFTDRPGARAVAVAKYIAIHESIFGLHEYGLPPKSKVRPRVSSTGLDFLNQINILILEGFFRIVFQQQGYASVPSDMYGEKPLFDKQLSSSAFDVALFESDALRNESNQLLADVAQANVTKPVIRKQIVYNYFPPYNITQLQQELVWDQQGKFCNT
ncbi:hypothetical protein DYB37_006268, partial [Aphanomyces astaci]